LKKGQRVPDAYSIAPRRCLAREWAGKAARELGNSAVGYYLIALEDEGEGECGRAL